MTEQKERGLMWTENITVWRINLSWRYKRAHDILYLHRRQACMLLFRRFGHHVYALSHTELLGFGAKYTHKAESQSQ